MNFFGKRDLVYLLIISILVLTAVFFAFKGAISESKYENYRATVLNRAIEGSIQLLGEYVETGNPQLSPFLASRLGELPLGSEEREAVTEFCRDVSLSGDNADSKRRAFTYAEELIVVLSENRRAIKHGDMTEFPLYDGEIPTLSQPVDNPYFSEAKKILGVNEPRLYTRGSVIGYRTASAYAEYENGVLLRYLCKRDGRERVSAENAKKDALKFAELYCGGGKVISESEGNGLFTYNFDGFYVVVSPYGGVMRFERTKI